MRNFKSVTIGVVFAGLSAFSNAQLPVIGDVLGGNSPLNTLGGLTNLGVPPMAQDLLSGNFSALPVAGLLLNPAAFSSLLMDPQDTLNTVSGLGLSLGAYSVPVLGVLLNDPAQLPFYFLDGGTILGDAVSAVPDIPLLTMPF